MQKPSLDGVSPSPCIVKPKASTPCTLLLFGASAQPSPTRLGLVKPDDETNKLISVGRLKNRPIRRGSSRGRRRHAGCAPPGRSRLGGVLGGWSGPLRVLAGLQIATPTGATVEHLRCGGRVWRSRTASARAARRPDPHGPAFA